MDYNYLDWFRILWFIILVSISMDLVYSVHHNSKYEKYEIITFWVI